MGKDKKNVQEVMSKENPEFVEACQGLSVDELDARLAQLAKDSQAVSESKDSDEALEQAQAEATALGAPYRDAKKAISLKSRYLIALIKERGGN